MPPSAALTEDRFVLYRIQRNTNQLERIDWTGMHHPEQLPSYKPETICKLDLEDGESPVELFPSLKGEQEIIEDFQRFEEYQQDEEIKEVMGNPQIPLNSEIKAGKAKPELYVAEENPEWPNTEEEKLQDLDDESPLMRTRSKKKKTK